jgi:predicted MFS family arabinose efflux permease
MVGNIASVALWVCASTFPIFLASRVVGGLSEGNVQLANAIAADVSTTENRGQTLALVGVAFSLAFTFGPLIGAWLSSKTLSLDNPFMTAALFSLGLLLVETIFIYFKLPETRKALTEEEKRTEKKVDSSGLGLLKFTHLFFLLIFSGMEFSLPFMTYDLFNYSSAQNGRVLGYIGLLASLLQGGFSRRAKAGLVAKVGLVSCATSFFLLAKTNTQGQLYLAATFLAVTSACVVTALNTLASLRADEGNRGRVLGEFRSAGKYFLSCDCGGVSSVIENAFGGCSTVDSALDTASLLRLCLQLFGVPRTMRAAGVDIPLVSRQDRGCIFPLKP